jgi:hypothetical protein
VQGRYSRRSEPKYRAASVAPASRIIWILKLGCVVFQGSDD